MQHAKLKDKKDFVFAMKVGHMIQRTVRPDVKVENANTNIHATNLYINHIAE